MEKEDGRRFGDIANKRNIQRTARFERTTHESSVSGSQYRRRGSYKVNITGLPFIDHLLHLESTVW